jgi:hypothetical protein
MLLDHHVSACVQCRCSRVTGHTFDWRHLTQATLFGLFSIEVVVVVGVEEESEAESPVTTLMALRIGLYCIINLDEKSWLVWNGHAERLCVLDEYCTLDAVVMQCQWWWRLGWKGLGLGITSTNAAGGPSLE